MKRSWTILLVLAVCGVAATPLSMAKDAEVRPGHVIPVDKELSRDYIWGLFERGMREVWTGKALDTIGMPVGGIAAGQLYLRGDGTLALWWIFNKHVFTGYGASCYRTYRPESPVDSGFAIVVEKDGKTLTKPLNRDFGTVEFAGEYPIGIVRYREDGFPVKVALTACSPFIPLNAKDSALPVTLFHISVENVSTQKLAVRMLGWLDNAVCIHSAKAVHALRRSRIVNEKGRTLIVHTAEKAPTPEGAKPPRRKIVLADFEGADYGDWKATGKAFGKAPVRGTLPSQQEVSGFVAKGLVNTYSGGDGPQGTLTSPGFTVSRKFINFLIGGGSHAGQTCINLLADGKVVRTATGKNDEKLEWYFWNVQEFEGKTAQIRIVDQHSGGWGHINIDQIELSDKPQSGLVGPVDQLPDYGSLVLALAKEAAPLQDVRRLLASLGGWATSLNAETNIAFPVTEKRSTALVAQPVQLAPGAKCGFIFALAWFFPNHQQGHEYANRFDSAARGRSLCLR
jgi:non-lysosomal glucosylceramidase